MKKIMMIPNLTYLSLPVFEELADRLTGHHLVYFDPDFINHESTFEKYEKRLPLLQTKFKDVIVYRDAEKGPAQGEELSRIQALLKLSAWSKRVIATIKHEDPDSIILGANGPFIYKLINTYFPKKKLFIIQQASLHPAEKQTVTLKRKLSYLVCRYGFKVPIF
ncbi:MAG: hypothetical protein Q7T54_00195, partial [Candidatus Levybacteria bacterium]|nr:hypothetical protein [Candidatus Levybacteria bacterium]